eukprot:scaffold1378_cov160-Amphora_coffeaeformis.AAC.1
MDPVTFVISWTFWCTPVYEMVFQEAGIFEDGKPRLLLLSSQQQEQRRLQKLRSDPNLLPAFCLI